MTEGGRAKAAGAATLRPQPMYFGPEDATLFGWYHAPTDPARDAVAVLCAPFGVEAIFAHRALRHCAERLAGDGFAVLRYDHHGTGDSAGSGAEGDRIAVWIAGVRTAIDFARALSGAQRTAIVGLRLGATLGTLAAVESGAVDSIALWAPIVNGRSYARELRAFSKMGTGAAGGAVGGFFVADETLASIGAIDLARVDRCPASRALVIPRDDLPDDGALARHLSALGCTTETSAVPGYAAALVEPHRAQVPEQVIDAIASWLSAAHPRTERRGVTAAHPSRPALVTHEPGAPDGARNRVRERAMHLTADGRVAGIFTEPLDAPRRGATVVLVNAGAVSRVGPHRLYVALAREWAARGYPVLRMDIGGIGDSGAAPGMDENDTYPATAVSDVVAAVRALHDAGERRIVVAGLCSGAHTSFHLGLEHAELEGLAGLMLVNPIVFYWKPGDALDVAAWQTYSAARWYQSRAASATAWKRLLQGKVNVVEVARTFARRGKTIAHAAVTRAEKRFNPGAKDDLARDLRALTAGPLDVLLVFSDGDPGYDQLNLHAGHALRALARRKNFRLVSIADADHTFTQLDAQSRVRAVLVEHLTNRFA